jgi:predicted nucleotidyltransferase
MVKMDKITKLGKSIGREFKAEKVILFGSYAYGRPLPDSDVDLLVVMRFRGKGVWKSVEILNRLNPDFSVDLLVRTPEVLRKRIRWNDFFLKEIMEKGKVLYEARH